MASPISINSIQHGGTSPFIQKRNLNAIVEKYGTFGTEFSSLRSKFLILSIRRLGLYHSKGMEEAWVGARLASSRATRPPGNHTSISEAMSLPPTPYKYSLTQGLCD